jgi:hypothetical protein
MTGRVLLDQSGLRVSKSGFDVTTATAAELSVDTRAGKMMSIILQGSVALSAFTVDSNTTSGGVHTIQSHYTINFGQTFAASPICLLTMQDPLQAGTGVNQAYANANVQVYYGGGSFNYGTGGAAFIYYTVTTSSLTISWYWSAITYSPPTPAFVNYSILRTS